MVSVKPSTQNDFYTTIELYVIPADPAEDKKSSEIIELVEKNTELSSALRRYGVTTSKVSVISHGHILKIQLGSAPTRQAVRQTLNHAS